MTAEPTLAAICTTLAETFTDDAIAIVLDAANRTFHGQRPIAMCQTVDGRREVLDWAESLTGMVAT